MNPRSPKGWHSRGYLPHFDSPERIQHVVFRTADSLPKSMRDARPAEIDARLDLCEGERPLADAVAAGIVESAIRHFDGVRFRLFAWVVTPNHAHVVIEPLPSFPLGAIVRSWKAFSAAKINKDTGARGPFWARDYFDRYIRDESDLEGTTASVENNPVVTGLVASPRNWPSSSARLRED